MAAVNLTAARLRELLNYDPETGVFVWLAAAGRGGRIPAGSVAGGVSGKGRYVMIWIDGRKHGAHRLAWVYMTGEWPTHEIDHENTVRIDNRWNNLRHLTSAQNNQNIHARRADNKSGVRGIRWCRDSGKWHAFIVVDKRQKHLGYFSAFDDAVASRKRAEAEFHPYRSPLTGVKDS